MEEVRAFIAIKLSPPLLEAVQRLQQKLDRKLCAKAIRWTKADQLHLTLWFLGNVDAARLSELEVALKTALAGAQPLQLSLENLGCFPSFKRPSVVWLAVGGQVEALQQLAARVIAHCRAFGEHEEKRPFKAHLTIARMREAPAKELERVGQTLSGFEGGKLGEWTASCVELVRSQLSPKGSVYSTLAAATLGVPS